MPGVHRALAGDLDIVAGSFYDRGDVNQPAATTWWDETN